MRGRTILASHFIWRQVSLECNYTQLLVAAHVCYQNKILHIYDVVRLINTTPVYDLDPFVLLQILMSGTF